ncbi:MAG: DUF1566 domain-containing protein [Candidatus Heimdallarchaeota archaeon]
MIEKKKKVCFVIMPFSDERKEVYTYGIKPACQMAGFTPIRVDELTGHFNINRKIIEHIFSSDVIIAELTDKNPNVYYELGVGHTIDNKTIMIVQNTRDLPFDIRNYRCIEYMQSVEGLRKLEEKLHESLLTIREWRKQPSNPVQDFKPPDSFIPKSVVEEVQRKLNKRESEISALQQEVELLRRQLIEKGSSAKASKIPKKFKLRYRPLHELSRADIQKMLNERDFFDSELNEQGNGLQQNLELVTSREQTVIKDHTVGLIWQFSGSEKPLAKEEIEIYIEKLNSEKFGNYNNWRLPTLEEAMSLMVPERMSGDLYISPLFDQTQSRIWTADKENPVSLNWVVYFNYGTC